MRQLKTKTIVAIVVFLAAAAFGSGLTDNLQAAGSRYRRDSPTNEPAARNQLMKDLNRIRAKASAKHESRIVAFVDSEIKDLEARNAPVKEWSDSPYRDLLLRPPPPYAKPVPDKPGFVFSPYRNDNGYKGYIDVRGFPPGTEVKDPYTGRPFLVP